MTKPFVAALAVAIALVAVAMPARAADVRLYAVRLTIGPDGAGTVVAEVSLENVGPGAIEIPIGFPGVAAIRVTGPAGVTATSEPLNGQSLARVVVPEGVTGSIRVTLMFDVPRALEPTEPAPGERATLAAGTRLLRPALLNTQAPTIGRYQLSVVFPAGTRAHTVRESSPKLRKSEAGPRAKLDTIDAQPGAVLLVDRLQQGETASMLIELVPRSRSLSWLIVGVVLSLGYLVAFRDMVSPRRKPIPPVS